MGEIVRMTAPSMSFRLPECVAEMVNARDRLCKHYAALLQLTHAEDRLRFRFDGNLIGDLGEGIAVERFGVRLDKSRGSTGVDGTTLDRRTIQIKATAAGRGPAFRQVVGGPAELLLFFEIDLVGGLAIVIFNGPHYKAVKKLPEIYRGQRSLTAGQIRAANLDVLEAERLQPLPVGSR